MKSLIKKLLRENLRQKEETTEEFYNRFNETNPNKEFLENNFKNPNFELRLTHDGGVEMKKCGMSNYNKCETNVFKFIQINLKNGIERYYPVKGWAFLNSTTYFEHYWIYDEVTNLFLEITPLDSNKLPYAYGGVIYKDINDEILNANSITTLRFGANDSYDDNPSVPDFDIKTVKKDNLFNYVMTNNTYSDLKNFINSYDNKITSIEGIKNLINPLEVLQDNARVNSQFNYYTKLIKQIRLL